MPPRPKPVFRPDSEPPLPFYHNNYKDDDFH